MKGAIVTERTALRLVLAALLASVTWGCGEGPKRNEEYESYPAYRAAALGLDLGGDDEGIDLSDDGDFGPESGLPTTSADEICSRAVSGTGSLRGVITFAGTIPKRGFHDLSKDPWCQSNHKVPKEGLVVNASKQIRDVVVFISKGMNRFDFEVPSTPAELNQEGCMYHPHVLTLMAGQELQVRNSDETSHNFHFIGSANDEINKTQPKPTVDSIYSLENPELGASFRCDIHGWMFAPTYVFSHPYFAVTDENGAFEIKNIPPGTYEVSFLHERKSVRYAARSVTITADNATEITVE